jgi:spore coat polysaccharide biosynthesis protein SpsF
MTHPDVISVIQARMSSSRLPGKVLRPMAGSPMLELMLERVRCGNDVPTVVATSTESSDDPIAQLCEALDVPVIRGPLDDVLARFIQALDRYQPRVVIRLTGDNPFTDGFSVQKGLESFHRLEQSAEYDWAGISNHLSDRNDPHGYAVEVLKAEKLRWLSKQGLTSSEREHVTLGFRNREIYRPYDILKGSYSGVRWTVDFPEDFEYMEALFADLGRNATVNEALDWSGSHPHPRIEETLNL